MTSRVRKFIGVLVLIGGITLYVMVAATIGGRLPDDTLIHVLYYGVAGVLWAFPAGQLIRWMQKLDA
ncbi:MAG: DUF2842 domain-containing protein [Parvularculales bacterium]